MNPELPSSSLLPAPRRRFGVGALLVAGVVGAGVTIPIILALRHTSGGNTSAAGDEPEQVLYQCPMHPSIVRDHPGDCPICGMKLVKIPKGQINGALLTEGETANAGPRVAGLSSVQIDPARQQLIGLQTVQVETGTVGGAWRTVGRVAIDERRVRHFNLKVSGFVERVFVDFVGKPVKKGDPLFSIYSPELLSTQEEFLLALRTRDALAKAGGAAANDGDALVAAARRKLSLWDVPDAQIDRIASSGEPTKTLTFYSPVAGVLTKKDIVDGMKLDAGAMPYEIVDLSTVWVLADVYESELRFVTKDMTATLSLNAFPNRTFSGKVDFIDPLLDAQSRTVKVRLTFPNPNGALRPEMFGEVVLHGRARRGLRIPPDAIIDSGTDKVVFVAQGAGKFQPRRVSVGDTDGSHTEIVSGLSDGERVVTRANFLVDSESRLRASLAELSGGTLVPESARVLPPGAPQEPAAPAAPQP